MLKRRHRSNWRKRGEFNEAIRDRADRLLVLALLASWPGRTGHADRRVFAAHLHIQSRSSKAIYGAAIREVAKLADLWPSTVVNATDRLVTMGLIEVAAPSNGREATTYRISLRAADVLLDRLLVGDPTPEVVPSLSLHSAFRYGTGLNPTVWMKLHPHSAKTPTEIADEIGRRSPSSVSRNLSALRDATLARRVKGGWIRCGDRTTLDSIARNRGLDERQQNLHSKIDEQRESHRSGLAFVIADTTKIPELRSRAEVYRRTRSRRAYDRLMRAIDEIEIAKSINDGLRSDWATRAANETVERRSPSEP